MHFSHLKVAATSTTTQKLHPHMTLLSKLYGNVKIFNISSPFSNIALRMLKVQSEVLGAVESSIRRCISPQEG